MKLKTSPSEVAAVCLIFLSVLIGIRFGFIYQFGLFAVMVITPHIYQKRKYQNSFKELELDLITTTINSVANYYRWDEVPINHYVICTNSELRKSTCDKLLNDPKYKEIIVNDRVLTLSVFPGEARILALQYLGTTTQYKFWKRASQPSGV